MVRADQMEGHGKFPQLDLQQKLGGGPEPARPNSPAITSPRADTEDVALLA